MTNTQGYTLHLLPPRDPFDDWMGYATHETLPDVADKVKSWGETAGECADKLCVALEKYLKDNP